MTSLNLNVWNLQPVTPATRRQSPTADPELRCVLAFKRDIFRNLARQTYLGCHVWKSLTICLVKFDLFVFYTSKAQCWISYSVDWRRGTYVLFMTPTQWITAWELFGYALTRSLCLYTFFNDIVLIVLSTLFCVLYSCWGQRLRDNKLFTLYLLVSAFSQIDKK